MDVTSLYTNIPTHGGLVAIADYLRRDPAVDRIGPHLLKLLRLILTRTNFNFNGEHYLQVSGTSMGTNVAPSYAILFMDKLECKALDQYHLKPIFYGRYIDDIFICWQHGLEELTNFLNYMNSQHESIQFTLEHSPKQVNFLDTTVVIDDLHRKLYTKLYTKPTDTHSYLHWTSAHYHPCKTKGPYGQFLRIRRICHRHEDFQAECTRLIGYYLNRGYPMKLLTDHYERANLLTQREALSTSLKVNQDKPVLVTDFNPRNPDIKGILLRHWNIIQFSTDCQDTFPSAPIIGYRRGRNLNDFLVRARITYPPVPLPPRWDTFRPEVCRRLGKCTYCPRIKKSDKFTSFVTKKTHKIAHIPNHRHISCEITNIIYLISCAKCGLQYVGETGRRARDRLYEQMCSIKQTNKVTTPVSTHFSTNQHTHRDLVFQVIERCPSLSDTEETSRSRKRKELFWIWLLRTITPAGINHMV
jgi:hypothetical protein